MKALNKNENGAVTVLVTLLLIPAILVSGTAVDLTRIYTARSIVQDANQMAANTVLTQYNALLHDLYGVFGVAEDDPILAGLLDDYIALTVFGESNRDTSLGTLQLFYGSNLSFEEVHFADEMNLRNPDVLRRQIEEYMKFRAPVIIVKEIMELLGSGTFKEDTNVIKDKLEIDEGIAQLYEKFKELYDAIAEADRCTLVPSAPAGAVGTVSSYLINIRDELNNLNSCLNAWIDVVKADDDEEDGANNEALKDELAARYRAIRANIRSWTIGGTVGRSWSNGAWKYTSNVQGLNETIRKAIDRTDEFKPKFDKVVSIAADLDRMNDELTRKVEELEARINSGECNEELIAALTTPDRETGMSVIDMYHDILSWKDIEGMADIFKDGGYDYIDGPLKDMLDSVGYRNRSNPSAPSLSRAQLENAITQAALALSVTNSTLGKLAKYSNDDISYKMPPGFVKFGEHPGDNEAFFTALEKMMETADIPPVSLFDGQEEADGEDAEEKQRNMIDELYEMAAGAYEGITNNPLGAKYISISSDGDGFDPIDAGNLASTVAKASSSPIAGIISDPMGSIMRAGDYLLLLTYSTSMFSNYATARPEVNGKSLDEIKDSDINFPKSISGIPISPRVNYFFQSEWEYLYHGSSDAGKNLTAVSGLIYLVRVICNYIAVFTVSEVTQVVSAIRTAFSLSPPLGIILGELARAAFVAAESAVDLATLRAGYKVSLIKKGSAGEWVCSPKGLAKALDSVLTDTVTSDENSDKDDKGLTYSNYLLFFFLTKGVLGESAALELTERTADLIEWNVLNYKHLIYCDEASMSEKLSEADRFKLEDMKTDFSITTTVDIRMLFLSMIVAQNFAGNRGVGLPQTFPVTMTDYRGY